MIPAVIRTPPMMRQIFRACTGIFIKPKWSMASDATRFAVIISPLTGPDFVNEGEPCEDRDGASITDLITRGRS
jgi:hypothetical protein